jgi:anaerobic ribonucleoside-triphosphate reductase activating protein
LKLLVRVKEEVNKPIYVWTGYTLEEILDNKLEAYLILWGCGVYLIDGRYEEDKKDLNLKLRGSSNQRIWDLHTIEPKDITEEIDK